MTNSLADRLRNNKPADAARIVDELDATLDRAEWSIVAHEAHVGAPAELKAAATRYFVRAARLYIQFLSPTFHMIPWDSSQLLPEDEFNAVFEDVRGATDSFNRVTPDSLRQLLSDHPSSLAVLRMIAWLSRNQISYLLEEHFGVSISGDDLRVLERQGRVGSRSRLERWDRASEQVASLLFLSVRGEMLGLREGVEADKFRPLTDKVDTRGGWESVARLSAEGVPYWALLYQRYVGGVNRPGAVQTSYLLPPPVL